jgi:hypothetical protein
MTTLALLLAVIILVTRLPLLLRDRPIRLWEIILCLTLQILLSLLVMEGFPGRALQWSSLVGTYSLVGLGWWWLEQEKKPQGTADQQTEVSDPFEVRRLVFRLVSSLLLIVLATWLGSTWTGTGVRPRWTWLLGHEAWFSPIGLLAKAPWRFLLITAFGLFLCLNEVSTLVRLALKVLNVKPSVNDSGSPSAGQERGSGRVSAKADAHPAEPNPVPGIIRGLRLGLHLPPERQPRRKAQAPWLQAPARRSTRLSLAR